MSDTKKIGAQSIRFSNPPVIEGWASVAGKKESQGPLGKYFDVASGYRYVLSQKLGRGGKQDADVCGPGCDK